VKAMPNVGTEATAGSGPRLDYLVNLTQTGTYYVWMRGHANGSGSDDSAHIGFDGAWPTSADKFTWSAPNSWTWTKNTMDGPVATLNVTSTGQHTLSLGMRSDGLRVDKLILTVSSAFTPTSGGPAESSHCDPTPTPTLCPYEPNADMSVCIEAEHYDAIFAANGHYWDPHSGPAGIVGTGMRALPNDGTSVQTGYSADSPRLDYRVNFRSTGTYYVWLRCYADDTAEDSCHIGLNGAELASGKNMNFSEDFWDWKSTPIEITSLGVQTLNVWMREDGLKIDRIIITQSPTLISLTESPRCTANGLLDQLIGFSAALIRPGTPTPDPSKQPLSVRPNVSRNGEPIHFYLHLEKADDVKLSLFNLAGEHVWAKSFKGQTGPNDFVWDLENKTGKNVASGLYIYLLEFGNGRRLMGKVAVLR